MFFDSILLKRACRASVFIALPLLTSCATVQPSSGLGELPLFDQGNSANFSFYFSCGGQVAVETELCWIPARYFSQWADERHISIKRLRYEVAFDAKLGVPAAEQVMKSGLKYRIVVRFAPRATPSYTSEVDGIGGYVAPKAGYEADLYVYSGADGGLVTQTNYHKKSDAPYRGDAVPYVKDGVNAVLAALDPVYARVHPVVR